MAVYPVTEDTFQTEVIESEKPVILDFWAEWCGPCRMIAPVLNEIAEEHEEIKVCRINVDEEPALLSQFRVMSIPTLIGMKKGEVTGKMVGACQKEEILALVSG